MKALTLIVAASVLVSFGFEAEAGRRQANQRARIRQGVKSGELSRDEAKDLRANQKNIRRAKKDAKADGSVSAEERENIRGMRKDASKDIYNQKHDDEKRASDEE